MTLEDIIGKYIETIKAIKICGENKCYESSVRLLYSAIDSLSWLYSDQMDLDKRKVKKEYEKWVNDFLIPELKKYGYDCTALELYLARCSQLHTFSAVAKKQKDIRIVAYVLGDKEFMIKTIQILPGIENISNGKKFVIMHIGDLVDCFINGTHKFFKMLEENNELAKKAISKVDYYYASLDNTLFNTETNNQIMI